jgi:hypothetical protein
MLWPLPEEDMTGLTTQGKPVWAAAASTSAKLSAKR